MIPTETLEAPAAAGPELLTHEWAANGDCLNPETITIPLAKDRKATLFLGGQPDGTWRVGYYGEFKGGDESDKCKTAGVSYPTRQAALVAVAEALQGAARAQRDKAAGRTIAVWAATVGVACDTPAPIATPLAALPKGRFAELPVGKVQPNPENPRKHFDAIAMRELADSIAQQGLLQPIAVRRLLPEELGEHPALTDGLPGAYEIILGERRWRACVMLGEAMPLIDAKVYEGVTRGQAKAAALVENLQREKMNPIEEAEGFRDLMHSQLPPLTQEQVAAAVGKSRPVIANALRVLELPEKAIELIRSGRLTLAHGVALARFKTHPEIVSIIAEEAAQDGVPASQIEKGLPYSHALCDAGVVARVSPGEFAYEVPAAIKKHPDYFAVGEYENYLLDAAAYESIKAEFKRAEKAEREAATEKERKRQEDAAKNPKKIKCLADLPTTAYAIVEDENKSLLALVPDETQLDLKDGAGEAVTVCTKPDLFRQIEKAVDELKQADRKAKWTKLIVQALNAVAKTKKIGPRESMLLVFCAQAGDNLYPAPALATKSAEMLGIKLPKKAINGEYAVAEIRFGRDSLALLLEAPGPVDCYRILIDSWLRQLENDLIDAEYDFSPDSDLASLVKWLLELDTLGFLEETKAGQKELLETVRAQDWYKTATLVPTTDPKVLTEWVRAFAGGMAIEEIARSYGVAVEDVRGALETEKKPAKKGGRK